MAEGFAHKAVAASVIAQHRDHIERLVGDRIIRAVPLAGGCIGEVFRLETLSGRAFVLKTGGKAARQGAGLPAPTPWTEAQMLQWLGKVEGVPVPEILHAEKTFLLMAYVETSPLRDAEKAEASLASCVAALHAVRMPKYGFDRPTPIGPLQRKNPWTVSWTAFFRDHRLMPFGRRAAEAGRLPEGCIRRLEKLCAQLSDWLPDTGRACLIHGDLWAGNILYHEDTVAGLIDPALFFADPEYELAFMPLFGGIGARFMARYREHHDVPHDFETDRLPLYQIEPLLVHACLFGGSYGARADTLIRRYVS